MNEKEKACHKNKGGGGSQRASEKRAEIVFSTQTQWQQWPLCQLVPHQFEEVKSAPGRLCLAWSHYRRSAGSGPNLRACSLLSQQSDPHFPALHSLLAGGKSGSRWGVGLPAPVLHPSNPWEVGEMTPADSNCQLARQRRGEPGTEDRGERRKSRRGEEKDDKGLGVSYPGRRLSGSFVV